MNARVTFMSTAPPKKETTEPKLYVVPRASVIEREGVKSVFVVVDGVVQTKPVSIAKEAGSDAFVSTGLTGSESIIVGDNLDELKIGDRVEIGQ
jgi:pentose-5-phosphate-3-epimerase